MVTSCPWSLAKSNAVVRPLTPALEFVMSACFLVSRTRLDVSIECRPYPRTTMLDGILFQKFVEFNVGSVDEWSRSLYMSEVGESD